jgi:MFS family permease
VTTGNLVLIGSAMMLGLVDSYPVLLVARAIHGIGSSCINVSGTPRPM